MARNRKVPAKTMKAIITAAEEHGSAVHYVGVDGMEAGFEQPPTMSEILTLISCGTAYMEVARAAIFRHSFIEMRNETKQLVESNKELSS